MSFEPTRPTAPEPFTPAPPEPFPPAATAPVVVQPPAPTTPKRKGSGGAWLNIILVIAAAVAIGGVAFAVGRSTAPASAAFGNGRGAFGNGNGFPGGSFVPGASGQPGFGRGAFGGGGLSIRGTVESITGDTLIIKTASGQTVEVTTGSATTYNTQSPASASDVKTGATVQVQLDFGGGNRPGASAAPGTPVGTAGSVTVIP